MEMVELKSIGIADWIDGLKLQFEVALLILIVVSFLFGVLIAKIFL